MDNLWETVSLGNRVHQNMGCLPKVIKSITMSFNLMYILSSIFQMMVKLNKMVKLNDVLKLKSDFSYR